MHHCISQLIRGYFIKDDVYRRQNSADHSIEEGGNLSDVKGQYLDTQYVFLFTQIWNLHKPSTFGNDLGRDKASNRYTLHSGHF